VYWRWVDRSALQPGGFPGLSAIHESAPRTAWSVAAAGVIGNGGNIFRPEANSAGFQ